MTTEGALIGDRYRLGEPIGRGRRGFVWLAQDERLHRTIAVMPIQLPRTTTPAAADRERALALTQAAQVSRIKHENVVTVYDVVPEGDDIWLIIEYVPSRPLSEFLSRNGRLPGAQTAALGAQLAAGLVAAHEYGVLHRGVEPANVLLADDGGVQLTDFGIGLVVQDPAYRAPEVLRSGLVSASSDVFSLGATLFTATVGAPPFGSTGNETAPSLPATDDVLAPVLVRMLCADPAMRPSMSGVADALTAVANGAAPSAESLASPAPIARPVPPVTRRTRPQPTATAERGALPTRPAPP
ncbi:MAG: protein kinase domain-containing protein, partial [Haloechinothrix sp.]